MPIPADCAALIMAGGRSERMRATAGPLHKALMPVRGTPLIERNLHTLLSEGFRDIAVAANVNEQAIGDYVETRGRSLARSFEADLRAIWEEVQLGTIGAAREAIGDKTALLVENVDNLTTLPLCELVTFHYERSAALTIAAHEEGFQFPFGELQLAGDIVEEYREKPVKPIWISSGTYVLSPDACSLIPQRRRTDIPGLVSMLISARMPVIAFRHASAWIDVNHAEALTKAEEMAHSL
jgi:NDP-sugar pyrophosphorylase family protein